MIYDTIIVGGGIGGSSLAKNLAEAGFRVLILERERRFKDRVRGEQMHPWGVSAARDLGIYDHLAATCGNQTRWWTTWLGGSPVFNRDLAATSPHRVGSFNVYHPAMQESLLSFAQHAGAEIRRGVSVRAVLPGRPPKVEFEQDGNTVSLEAHVVVGADGRNSQVRSSAGFQVQRDPDHLMIAGLLVEGIAAPEDATHQGVGRDVAALIAPLGNGRARLYYMYRKADGVRGLSGDANINEFLACCQNAGLPATWFDNATPAGPLAEFNGADRWIQSPARDRVVLIGDAAAECDPNWGTGLSVTLLDVLSLRNSVCSSPDWDDAILRYAAEHDRHYSAVHEVTRLFAELLWTTGPDADQRRNRILPRLLTAPDGLPDVIGLGPDSPLDEEARTSLLGPVEAARA